MKHLFLKGDSGTGKTTLLRNALKQYHGDVGGFLTRRLLDEWGETAGFCLVPVAYGNLPESIGKFEIGIKNLFIERTSEGWKKYPEVFESAGVNLLSNLKGKSVCYLDEIGGVEMKSERFMNALYQVLDSDIYCIGVIKNERNLNSMGTRVPMEQDSRQDRSSLEWEITQEYGGQVIPYSEDRREDILAQVQAFIKGITSYDKNI